MVGDPKQAIYRFRRRRRADLPARSRALEAAQRENVLTIGRNFRSVAPILEWVNQRFAAPLSADGQPGFAPCSPTRGHRCRRQRLPSTCGSGATARTEFVTPRRRRSPKLCEADRRLCRFAIATQSLRPCRAGDIALLAPTGRELWRYERAWKPRHPGRDAGRQRLLPTPGSPGPDRARLDARRRTGHARARRALAWPAGRPDRGSLLDALAAVPRPRDGTRACTSGGRSPTSPTRCCARRWRSCKASRGAHARPRRTVLLAEAVEEMRVRPVLRQRGGRRPNGRWPTSMRFLDMARAWNARGLRAFAQAMRAQWRTRPELRRRGQTPSAKPSRSITMHAAKGLEWSVVIPSTPRRAFRQRARRCWTATPEYCTRV